MTAVVEMQIVSVKKIKRYNNETKQYNGEPEFEVELEVPYNQNSDFFKLSGGTNTILRTINQSVGNSLKEGQFVKVEITPIENKFI